MFGSLNPLLEIIVEYLIINNARLLLGVTGITRIGLLLTFQKGNELLRK